MTRIVEWDARSRDRDMHEGLENFLFCLGLASIEFGYPGVRIILLLLNSNMFIEYVFKTLSPVNLPKENVQ